MTQSTAAVLQAVAAGHMYGFDIMDATGLQSGTVFPILRRLESAGIFRGRWEPVSEAHRGSRPQRRLYELTETGVQCLAEARKKLAHSRSMLESLMGSEQT
jgi:DNA-binding PadR family transcriptional regulator